MVITELQAVAKIPPRLFIVMGVSGSGKSSIAALLADEMNGCYLDGDDYHPNSNIEKMSQGIPLNDDDRWPWLAIFADAMSNQSGKVIGACSSLKKSYREHLLKTANEPILFIYLDGSKELILKRMAKRRGHFMPSSQLDDQFKTLEIPDNSELAINLNINGTSEEVLSNLMNRLETLQG